MDYPILVDSHTHSDHSPDGIDPVSAMCEYAEKAGLYAVAITDHCEIDSFFEDSSERSLMQSYISVMKAKTVYGRRLEVLAGVEFGQVCHNPEVTEKALKMRPFDFILASVHRIRGHEDFYFLDYSTVDFHEVFAQYLDELAETVAWDNFDSLAHLTYPLRYVPDDMKFDISPFNSRIDEILKNLAKSGKALEINTSGLRQKIGVTLPPQDIVKRFRELGGELITIGSDAHKCRHVAYRLVEGMKSAKAAGFNKIVFYKNRKPIEIKI